jgi:hypothetical protein
MDIAEKLVEYPRVINPKNIEIIARGRTFPACLYTDKIDETETLYIVGERYFLNKNKPCRFVDDGNDIWFIAAYKDLPIEEQFKKYHPFGANVILKKISAEMAKQIGLSLTEVKIYFLEVK